MSSALPTDSGAATVVSAAAIFCDLPPEPDVDPEAVAHAAAVFGRLLVVLDDDPTGTQTVAELPVVTAWEVDDLRWGLKQNAPALFVSTNTRSLSAQAAEARLRAVVSALVAAARAEDVPFVIAARSDSTLRGHYPLEVDVIADCLAAEMGTSVDGVVIAPAFLDAGRLTVASKHWARTGEGFVAIGESEFARDRTFGFRSSDLRDYVEEKTGGVWSAADVAQITIEDLRVGGVQHVAEILESLHDRRPIVVDAVCETDLSVLALAIIAAEERGRTFLYRVGPSFVRSRIGMRAQPALTVADISRAIASQEGPYSGAHGLVVVGSHMHVTTQQLERLQQLDGIETFELHVPTILGDGAEEHARAVAAKLVGALDRGDAVVFSSREVDTSLGAGSSLAASALVSAALVEVVRAVVARQQPAWVIAKGGITSLDVALYALGIRHARVVGSMLPGIVSLWLPAGAALVQCPFVVFPGNVGDDDALAQTVTTLRETSCS